VARAASLLIVLLAGCVLEPSAGRRASVQLFVEPEAGRAPILDLIASARNSLGWRCTC
jgi:hypothetical protein